MTLIVALQGSDGLVLAADSRGTIGDPRGLTAINDTYSKLFKLSHFCGIGISGASELAANFVDQLRPNLSDNHKQYADEVLVQTRALVRSCYDDWFSKFPVDQRPILAFTVVGFQMCSDGTMIPRTYLLTSHLDFAPQLFPTGNCLSGVPQYAVYLMHRLYHPDMTVENLTRLAAYLIAETATQDPKVGGPIRIATIRREEGFRELDTAGVAQIVSVNNEQSRRLQQFFFGGEYHATEVV